MCIVTYDDTPCFLFLETVNTVSLLATVCDTLSAAYRLLFSAGLSECRFSVPAPIPGGVASLALRKKRSSQSHIPFSRSFSCNRRLGNKKSRHINMYRPPEKG